MALTSELYCTSASRLDSFVAQWVQPNRDWKEEVLEAVWTVEQFLREETFQGEHGLDQDVRVLKVVKVGSFGNGTVIRSHAEVELVVFLRCFQSFQEAAKHHETVLRMIWKRLWHCQDLLDLGLDVLGVVQGIPDALVFTINTRKTAESITVTILPAYKALGPLTTSSQPHPEVYVNLIQACGYYPGHFSPSFCELQRNFVKHRPTKLKSLLRLVKHWYLQYVKAKCPRAMLPPLYALELLTIYAWEMGTQGDENFRLDEGLTTVMELLKEYEFLCIYWTKNYTFQNPVIKDFVRKEFKRQRPIILDPADPTNNVAEGYRWDIVAQRACQCLKQDCCYDKEDPVPSWNVKNARDIQVTVEQWGYPDLILRVNPYEPIRKVKEKIRQSRGYLGLQRLSFQEPGGERQLLSSRSCLADFGIFLNTPICLLETVSSEIQVFVKNPDGGSDAYAIDPNGFVMNLKQQIEDKQGILRNHQQLKFQGHILQDWWAFVSYNIEDSDTLILSEVPFPYS